MRNLTICFVSQEYPEETGWGGIGTYTYEMAHGLARLGHKVVVLTRALSEASYEVEANGVHVYRVLPSFKLDRLPILWRLNRVWRGYNAAVSLKLREIVNNHQIDLIEAPEIHAETLLYMLTSAGKVPIVIRLHGGTGLVLQFEDHKHPKLRLNRGLERKVVSRATMVTAPGNSILELSRSWLPLGANSLVVPNPVNTQLFSPNGCQSTNGQPRIVCAGTPRHIKGFHVLARAIPSVWKSHPEARFVFAAPRRETGNGDGFRAALGDLCEHPKVELRMDVPHSDMPKVYQSATVCVVPSLWESFGYACAEAMACGVPVVASRIGGLAEIIEDRVSGILAEPENPEVLADAISNLISDPRRRVEIGLAARQRIVKEFSSSVIATRMASVYEQLISHSLNGSS
jgi:glycogen(starch) synthase